MSRVRRSLLLHDLYRSYKARMAAKGLEPKPYNKYKEIIETMGKVMGDILCERGIVAMPWRMGDLFVKRRSDNKPVYDKKKSADLNMRVFIFNEHTDGIAFTAFWLSPERLQKKRKMWCFSLYRVPQRKIARLLISKQVEYPDFQMMSKVSLKRKGR